MFKSQKEKKSIIRNSVLLNNPRGSGHIREWHLRYFQNLCSSMYVLTDYDTGSLPAE